MSKNRKEEKYIILLKEFIFGEIAVDRFEKKYLSLFKSETEELDIEIFAVLNTFFSDVDSYCGDESIANYNKSDPFHDIDKIELMKRAKETLRKLAKIQE